MASIEETQGLLGGNKALPSSSVSLDKSDADAGVWLVRAAARALSDGLSGRKVRPPPARTPKALRAHIFRLKHQPVAWVASIMLLALAFYEPPYWCQTSAKCKADWTTYPTMHLNYLSEGGAIAWTLVCLVPLALDEVLRVRANGKKNYLGLDLCSVKGLSVPLLLLFSLACVVMNATLPSSLVRALRLRPAAQLVRSSFVVLHDRELRAQFGVIFRLLPRFLRFLMLLLFVGFFYSLFGMSIFPEKTSLEGEVYFSDIGESLWNFELLLTSNILPGAMIDAWKVNQPSVLYILAAIVIAYFYFLNLVLAVVYDGYLEQKREFVLATQYNYAGNLEIAFGLLEQCSSHHASSSSSSTSSSTSTMRDKLGDKFGETPNSGGDSSYQQHGSSSSGGGDTGDGEDEEAAMYARIKQATSAYEQRSMSGTILTSTSTSTSTVDNARVRLLLDELEKLSCFDTYGLRRNSSRNNRASAVATAAAAASGGGGGASGIGSEDNAKEESDSLVWNFLERQDPSAPVDRLAFARVCHLTQMQFRKRKSADSRAQTFVQQRFPEVYESKCFGSLSRFVKSKAFANTFAVILVFNTAFLLLEVQGEPLYDRTVLITTVFVGVYSVELLLVLLVRGWDWYWTKSIRRRLEFVALVATAVLLPLVIMSEDTGSDPTSSETDGDDLLLLASSSSFSTSSSFFSTSSSYSSFTEEEDSSTSSFLGMSRVRLLRFLLVMRCTPTIRLLGYVGDYTTFAKVTMALLPRAYQMMKVLLMVMYVFSIGGMLLFAGLISWKDPALDGTAYLANGFESLNFNDMASSMLVMTQVLVVNEFDVMVGGFVAVTSKWARLYFTAFYLLGVLLILNIVIAVMLDSYITSMHQTLQGSSRGGGGGGDNSNNNMQRRDQQRSRQKLTDAAAGAGGGAAAAASIPMEASATTSTAATAADDAAEDDLEGGGARNAAAAEREKDKRCAECLSKLTSYLPVVGDGGGGGSRGGGSPTSSSHAAAVAVCEQLVEGARVDEMLSATQLAGGDGDHNVEVLEGALLGLEGQYEPANLHSLRSSLVAEALLPHAPREEGNHSSSNNNRGGGGGGSAMMNPSSPRTTANPKPHSPAAPAAAYGATPSVQDPSALQHSDDSDDDLMFSNI